MITIQPEIEILSTESYEDMLRRIEKIGSKSAISPSQSDSKSVSDFPVPPS